MGSGLVLLVIVGAWLAVLVPMFLRSHDHAVSMSSVDRFSDAMRVLSRRQGAERRSVVVPPAPRAASEPTAAPGRAATRPVTRSAATRRRRTLLGLAGTAGLTLLLSMSVSWLLGLHVAVDLLIVAFVVHCRRQELARREVARRRSAARPAPRRAVPGPAPAVQVWASTSSAPDRPGLSVQPAAPVRQPVPVPEPALGHPAARHEDPLPRQAPAAALGEAWSPVPVPRPTYVTAPVATRRPRVLDLTRPGEWAEALGDEAVVLPEDGRDLERILERRRAVNG